jgi:hypothetical protein
MFYVLRKFKLLEKASGHCFRPASDTTCVTAISVCAAAIKNKYKGGGL